MKQKSSAKLPDMYTCEKSFQQIDKQNTGVLNSEQIADACRLLGYKDDYLKIMKILSIVASKRQRILDLFNYQQYVQIIYILLNLDEIRNFPKILFLYYQKNFCGYLTGSDLHEWFNSCDMCVSVDHADLLASFMDKDSRVQYVEFESLLKELM